MGFVPTVDFTLDSIALAVERESGPNELDVSLMSWESQFTVLESFHFSNAMPLDDGFVHPPLITNSTLHPVLLAGHTYWLTASQVGNSANSYALWKFNSIGASGLFGGRVIDANGHTNGWGGSVTTAPGPGAFEITGTPIQIPSNALPVIVVQPASQTITVGGPATFSVNATGVSPLFYQWRFNGSALSNASNSVLTIGNVQAVNAGAYMVIVSNTYGSVTSSVATLTVIDEVSHHYHYVNATNPTPAWPYDTWATAASRIQDAVDAATMATRCWSPTGSTTPAGGGIRNDDQPGGDDQGGDGAKRQRARGDDHPGARAPGR